MRVVLPLGSGLDGIEKGIIEGKLLFLITGLLLEITFFLVSRYTINITSIWVFLAHFLVEIIIKGEMTSLDWTKQN